MLGTLDSNLYGTEMCIRDSLNYEGYPKSVCISVDDVVCHGIPSEDTILKSGQIVNVDCTTIFNGYYGDASRCV